MFKTKSPANGNLLMLLLSIWAIAIILVLRSNLLSYIGIEIRAVGWGAWNVWDSDNTVFINLLILCIPMAAFCLAVGIMSLKRFSATGGYWIIFGLITAQVVAIWMFGHEWLNIDWHLRISTAQLVWATIGVGIIFAIPGLIVNKRVH